MAEFALRLAVPDDASSMARVHVAAWRIGYAGLLPDSTLAGLSQEVRERMWNESLLERQYAGLLREIEVATVDAAVVGFVASGTAVPHDPVERAGEVYAIYVHPDWWSRGIGGALLSSATQRLRHLGMETGRLWMVRGNSRAQEFYNRAGWSLDGKSRVAKMVGLPDVPMALAEVRFSRQF